MMSTHLRLGVIFVPLRHIKLVALPIELHKVALCDTKHSQCESPQRVLLHLHGVE